MADDSSFMGPSTPLPSASARLNQLIVLIREYMRDQAELNRLIKGQESSDRQIAWAIMDAIDHFSTTPPFVGNYGITAFPSMSLLKRMAVADLMESVALLQVRNHLNYNDGGISVSVSDKFNTLMQWAQMYRQSTDLRMDRMKRAINVELAMRGHGALSEYFIINGVYMPGF